jgi:hypothetical protein
VPAPPDLCSRTAKPLSQWSKEEVRRWLLAHENCAPLAALFPFAGRFLNQLSEEELIEVLGPDRATPLFRAVQELKDGTPRK